MRRAVLALSVLMVLVTHREARAQTDFVGVRALGMGEAVRAEPTGATAPLLNPAGMSLTRQYVVEGGYGLRIEDLGHHAYVAIVDSVTTRVAAGLYYNYLHASPKLGFNWAGGLVEEAKLTRTGHVAGLALSIALGSRFILGFTTKYLNLKTTAPLPEGAVPAELALDSVNGVSFDVGFILRLGDKFSIGAVGYNLWDHGSRESPLSLGLGLSFKPIQVLSLNLDSVINFTGYKSNVLNPDGSVLRQDGRTTVRLGPGIELLAGGKVPVRVGYIWDSAQGAHGSSYLSLGLGYASTRFGVDLSYRAKLGGGIENFLLLGVRLFVN